MCLRLIVRRWRRLSLLLIAVCWLQWFANLWDIDMRLLPWNGIACFVASQSWFSWVNRRRWLLAAGVSRRRGAHDLSWSA